VFSFENPVDTSLASYSVVKEPTLAGRGRPDCQTPPPMSSEIGRFHPLGMLDRFRLTSARCARSFPRAEMPKTDRRPPASASLRQRFITTYRDWLFHRFNISLFSMSFHAALPDAPAELPASALPGPSKIARMFPRAAGVLTTPARLVISDVVLICCWLERRRELRTPHPHSLRRLAG
jgi:hypothetical protein